MEHDTTIFGRVCEWAYRHRRALLVLVVVTTIAFLALIVFEFWVRFKFRGSVVFAVASFLLTQLLFFLPRKHWKIRLTASGRSMPCSLAAGAAVASVISVGLVAALLEIPDWWEGLALTTRIGPLNERFEFLNFAGFWLLPVFWILWTPIFFLYFRGPHAYGQLSRMIRTLIAGSILELLVSVPVYAFLPDRHRCYCARGSYTGIVFGATALVWIFGPAVALVFFYQKSRAIRPMNCPKCEYDLRGTIAAGRAQCPECGAGIDPALLAGTSTN